MCNLSMEPIEVPVETPAVNTSAVKVTREWPKADDDKLREMWAQGATGGQIAEVLGKSRNAVLGRAFRMKLDPRGMGWGQKGQRKAKAQRRTPVVQARMLPEPAVVALVAQPISPATTTLLETLAKCQEAMVEVSADPELIDGTPLADLRGAPGAERSQCRWPLNSVKRGGEYLFCRETAVEGSSYCDCHTKKAWAKFRTEVA